MTRRGRQQPSLSEISLTIRLDLNSVGLLSPSDHSIAIELRQALRSRSSPYEIQCQWHKCHCCLALRQWKSIQLGRQRLRYQLVQNPY